MTLPDDWEDSFKRLYERTYQVLMTAGCDVAQAEAIAKERVVKAAEAMANDVIAIEDYPQT